MPSPWAFRVNVLRVRLTRRLTKCWLLMSAALSSRRSAFRGLDLKMNRFRGLSRAAGGGRVTPETDASARGRVHAKLLF